MWKESCTAFRGVISKVHAYMLGRCFINFVKRDGELLNLLILQWDVSLSSVEMRGS